jgi:hypothetical protein
MCFFIIAPAKKFLSVSETGQVFANLTGLTSLPALSCLRCGETREEGPARTAMFTPSTLLYFIFARDVCGNQEGNVKVV